MQNSESFTEHNLQAEIRKLFLEYPDALYGFADIAYSPYACDYASALVFAVPYTEQLTHKSYSEERFERGIQFAKIRLEAILARLETILRGHGAGYWIPPTAQESEDSLLAPFSFKFAAVNAGLGWVGKNDVIITQRYGPRIQLSVVLIDAVFDCGTPITASACPESCRECADICPCGALKNQLWSIDTRRADIIDYQRCNRMRSAYIDRLGRKHACGLCLTVCPIGTGHMTTIKEEPL